MKNKISKNAKAELISRLSSIIPHAEKSTDDYIAKGNEHIFYYPYMTGVISAMIDALIEDIDKD